MSIEEQKQVHLEVVIEDVIINDVDGFYDRDVAKSYRLPDNEEAVVERYTRLFGINLESHHNAESADTDSLARNFPGFHALYRLPYLRTPYGIVELDEAQRTILRNVAMRVVALHAKRIFLDESGK